MPSSRRDLLLLSALCAVLYATGLTTYGLSNWQESQRVIVAREMQQRGGWGGWLVPTINGRPYLAKPPLMYWAQLSLAKVTGRQLGIFKLRLTVALAGLAGVLATYLVARRMFSDALTSPPAHLPTSPSPASPTARDIALWSSLCLATGFLYVHSSRVGELDILLVLFVVIAIGAIATAWRSHRDHARTHWPAIAIATLAATGAVLTKGPPGLLVIALAGYGGIALWHMTRRHKTLGSRLRECILAYSRTHPVAVLGLPLVALWGWGRLVQAHLGSEDAAAFANQEAEDNLRFFVVSAPLTNLAAAAYGVGLGSVAAALCIIWLISKRRRDPVAAAVLARPEWWIVFAWVGLSLIAFSVLGKGVTRYLTPLWPGMAMLAGLFLATAITQARDPRRLRLILATIVISLTLGQAWWYALGRDWKDSDKSPRDLVGELLHPGTSPALRTDADDLATFEFRTPAIDYYAGRFIQPIGDIGQRDSIAGTTPWTLEDLKQHLAVTGRPMVLLVRTREPGDRDPRPAVDRLALEGLMVQTMPLSSRFTIDSGRTPVAAVRVSAPSERGR